MDRIKASKQRGEAHMGRQIRCPVCYGLILTVVDGEATVATRCRKCGAWLLLNIEQRNKWSENGEKNC